MFVTQRCTSILVIIILQVSIIFGKLFPQGRHNNKWRRQRRGLNVWGIKKTRSERRQFPSMLSPRHISPLPPIAPHCEEQDVVSNEAAHNTIVLHPLPPLSMHQGQDDTIMATTSDTITKLASQLIEPLDTRAKALANGAQFDLALRDAAMMRALAPTSALGYLRAGSIYQQQGHQQAAMNMYKQGLMAVDPTNPWYSRLKTSYAAALEVQEKRVDFMSKLPADIVSMAIIPLLFESYELRQDTVCPHFNVCRTWCQRILANNAFHFLLHDGGCVDDPAYDLLPYSPHFKTLTVAHRQDWVEILNERPWTRLSHLNVDCKCVMRDGNMDKRWAYVVL